MKANYFFTTIGFLAAVLLVACGNAKSSIQVVPEGAQVGDLIGLDDCEYESPDSKIKYDAECGTLIVPENWEKADSRLIELPVVRIEASGQNRTEPVFYLQGGPGGPNLVWSPPEWLLENHDVVMVGYRGVEGTVTLACPEVNRLIKTHSGKDAYSDQARSEYLAAVRLCAEDFEAASVDLAGYTITGVIEDLEAARDALGYSRINLFSESYGTRVAQIYAYLYPENLYRLVLIGVNTPGHFIWKPADFDKMIEHISELCSEDAYCNSRTDDFSQTMYDVNHSMPESWLVFKIDPGTVRLGTHFMFMSNLSMPMTFDAYLAAAEGDPAGLAMFNLMISLMMTEDVPVWGDEFNKGGTVDMEKYAGLESVSLGDSIMGAPLSEFVWPLAEAWPMEMIPQELREFQESDVEMLLVNGTIDFSTPPSALDEARPYYHKAQMVLLPEFSHTQDVFTLQPEAFQRLITSYYDTGIADDSLYVYQPLSFKPGMSLQMAARLLVAATVVLPALIVLGIVSRVRRVRKRNAINQF